VAQQKDNKGGLRGLVIGMIVFVLVVGVGASVLAKQSSTHAATPSAVSKADGYGIVFNPKGSPTVDIWEDFQCPICGRFESINGSYIESLARDNKVKVVFHTLSFIGPESILAANAGGCSAEQGKFLEFQPPKLASKSFRFAPNSRTSPKIAWGIFTPSYFRPHAHSSMLRRRASCAASSKGIHNSITPRTNSLFPIESTM
jgi:hypothetical protein